MCSHCHTDNVTCEVSPVEFDWEVTDSALPDINTEYLELQLSLMLGIAEEVRGTGITKHLLAHSLHHLCILGTDKDILKTQHAIFSSISSSPATGKFEFQTPYSGRTAMIAPMIARWRLKGKKGEGKEKAVRLVLVTPCTPPYGPFNRVQDKNLTLPILPSASHVPPVQPWCNPR
ncbi:hypothetical protein B0H13DRAFT_2394887 [Mycena leptocephala]|nr:hypothetical protein B0H13DRAFT_2394887 [Mycena leptocephala]